MAAKKAPATKKPTSSASRADAPDRLYTEQVRALVNLMVRNDLTTLEIVNGDLKVTLGRGFAPAAGAAPVMHWPPSPAPAAAPAQPAPAVPAAKAEAAEPAGEQFLEIRSPMVGTFYSAPSPDSDPYVTTGARVTSDTVVCIVEAMKVMNEIKAECSGTIVEVSVKNGQPVEYGQVLFRVRPE